MQRPTELMRRLEGLKKFAATDAFVAINREETFALLAYIDELEKLVQFPPSVPAGYVLVNAATMEAWQTAIWKTTESINWLACELRSKRLYGTADDQILYSLTRNLFATAGAMKDTIPDTIPSPKETTAPVNGAAAMAQDFAAMASSYDVQKATTRLKEFFEGDDAEEPEFVHVQRDQSDTPLKLVRGNIRTEAYGVSTGPEQVMLFQVTPSTTHPVRRIGLTDEEMDALCHWWRMDAIDALRWLVNIACGVGKAGGAPEPGEFEEAVAAGKAALGGSTVAQEPARQTASHLRRAAEAAIKDATMEGRLWDGQPAYVSIGMHAYQGLVDALSATEEVTHEQNA